MGTPRAVQARLQPAGELLDRGQKHRLSTTDKQALAEAPPAIKRQVLESFEPRIAYDRAQRRVELTATVSEAVADAFENAKALHVEGSGVVVTDIAGGGI